MTGTGLIFSILTWIVPLVIAIVLHEIAHGWVANAFGDPTARRAGRLSLNPVRHVDPIGTVALPLVLAISGAPLFGWAKPVPVTPSLLRNPRWHGVLVSAAGPGINLVLAMFAAFAYGIAVTSLDGRQPGVFQLFVIANLFNFMTINLFLAVFNMLPVPPLDGGHVVAGLLPPSLGARYERLGRLGIVLLMVVIVAVPLLFPHAHVAERILLPPVRAIQGLLLGGVAGLG
jgi:Zn-dependent protease